MILYKTKKKKNNTFFHYFFLALLLIAIVFEFIYFIRLKPFNYPLTIDFTPDLYIQDLLLERKLAKISLEEKVGALFIIGFNGYELNEETKEFFQKHYFKNFLLFKKNIKDENQLKSLICNLPTPGLFTGENNPGVGLPGVGLIAVDQEGGRVNRINFNNIDKTSQSEIKTTEQAYQIAKDRGEILANLGINMNFAPVVEIIRDENSYLSVDKRAFLGDNQHVSALSSAFISGYNDKGVIAVIKHFPGGLGRQNDDPHQSLPILNISKQELDQDIIPFQNLIQSRKVKAIMTTHILYPQIDPKNPVTTSEKFIRSILRGELGFRGVIVTDDLIMGAMKGYCAQCPYKETVEQSAKKAFLAGHDLILISGPSQVQDQAYQAILEAVQSGEISKKRLHNSLKRIMKLVD